MTKDLDEVERELSAVLNRTGVDSWLEMPDYAVAELLVDVIKGLRRLRLRLAKHGWSESEPEPVREYRRHRQRGRRLVPLDARWERLPNGLINNCALANGDDEANCQVCDGHCPDRARFGIPKEGES